LIEILLKKKKGKLRKNLKKVLNKRIKGGKANLSQKNLKNMAFAICKNTKNDRDI